MPKLDVTIPQGQLSDEARRELPEQLAAALLRWEGAPDTEFFRSISWAHLRELPADAIRTPDGEAKPHAVVDVTVPQGALSERRRGGMVEEMTKLVLEATGWEGDDAAIRVWVLVHEVPDGFWGAGGQIIRFEQLRAAAKAESEGGDGAAAVEAADRAPA
jgi:phenylpyruvate tautomerase PptA (4-oxalocrotonate tautomerase family)